MSIPIVAIVGRPNVGKSTIFNRMVGKKLAIVDPQSGVTRDRKYYHTKWNGFPFIVVDTGGIVPSTKDTIERSIKAQAQIAIEEADAILFVADSKTGITDYDEQIARILLPLQEKVLFTVNKVDSEKDEPEIYEFLNLGLGEPIGIAAINGKNFSFLLDEIVNMLPSQDEKEKMIDEDTIKIAVVGKPNVGKSSLVNKIMGQEAVIVTEIPGTTRDSVHLNFTFDDHKFTIIDTAGLRRKSKVKFGIEYFSNIRSLRSIESADIVLIMLDAQEEVSVQDKRIIEYAQSEYKGIILVVNKWDLIEKETGTSKKFEDEIYYTLNFVNYAPIIFISAKTGQRVDRLLSLILHINNQLNKRISTHEMNEFLKRIIAKNPPKHPTHKRIKFYYTSQVDTHPPVFIFSVNNPTLVTENYKRYILNQIYQTFDFEGVTIKLKFKGRS
ncbi:MAG TPA: ribosome biogenesis GTPase Der [Candidatus Cloacimonetes bacterium]|nr:ribosome biogenesis GTPase Der [Candidatus Cloacimonadota bacterium]HEX37610.1 ribosome biogenesis GTPase Der [Candidatus Cloacimonadota bacterium]